jgi:hypothetical protein
MTPGNPELFFFWRDISSRKKHWIIEAGIRPEPYSSVGIHPQELIAYV